MSDGGELLLKGEGGGLEAKVSEGVQGLAVEDAQAVVAVEGKAFRFCQTGGVPGVDQGVGHAKVLDGTELAADLVGLLVPKDGGKYHPDGTGDGGQYIANMRDGAVAGFKYFDIREIKTVSVELSGAAEGEFLLSGRPDFQTVSARIQLKLTGGRAEFRAPCAMADGERALYFKFCGVGCVDFHFFSLKGAKDESKSI